MSSNVKNVQNVMIHDVPRDLWAAFRFMAQREGTTARKVLLDFIESRAGKQALADVFAREAPVKPKRTPEEAEADKAEAKRLAQIEKGLHNPSSPSEFMDAMAAKGLLDPELAQPYTPGMFANSAFTRQTPSDATDMDDLEATIDTALASMGTASPAQGTMATVTPLHSINDEEDLVTPESIAAAEEAETLYQAYLAEQKALKELEQTATMVPANPPAQSKPRGFK